MFKQYNFAGKWRDIAGNGQKWHTWLDKLFHILLNVAGNSWIWLNMAEQGWQMDEMAGNGSNMLELAENG